VHKASIVMPRSEEIYQALSVEAGREIHRTSVNIRMDENLVLEIQASDTHALRAAINSYLGWLQLAYDVMEVIEDGS
jgi:KEOPS complex subunit Pcc1